MNPAHVPYLENSHAPEQINGSYHDVLRDPTPVADLRDPNKSRDFSRPEANRASTAKAS